MMFSRAKAVFAALTIAATLAVSTPAYAKSIQDYEAMSANAQAEYMLTFLEKMTYDIGQKDPDLARRIKDYFVPDVPGKPLPEGSSGSRSSLSPWTWSCRGEGGPVENSGGGHHCVRGEAEVSAAEFSEVGSEHLAACMGHASLLKSGLSSTE